jgi:hypothetical protein
MDAPIERLSSARGGPLSRLLFLWAWPSLRLGHQLGGKLTSDHLPELRESERPEHVTALLTSEWAKEQAKAAREKRAPALLYALWCARRWSPSADAIALHACGRSQSLSRRSS